jgi:hypothetical protein
MPKNERSEFLLASFTAAREELLFRITNRDNWLKLQLLVQAALLALAQGVELGGVRFSQPLPDVLLLSTSVSLIFVCLYHAEERLIGFIANYAASLTEREAQLHNSKSLIDNWDHSHQVRQYTQETLPLRYIAVSTVFVFFPIVLTLVRVGTFTTWGLIPIIEVIFHAVLIVITLLVVMRGYRARKKRWGGETPKKGT